MYSGARRPSYDDDDPTTTTTDVNSSTTGGKTPGALNNWVKSQQKMAFPRKKYASSYDMKLRLDDPSRFSGDGVDFKSKFIGEQEVQDARGDRMCQSAMQICKARAKRRGQHKQRIWFNVSLKGFKIKDQMTGVVLYSFPVNKVSFIAKDITDGRAFGFVYGAPEEKHKFFAIKTEKSANTVVFSIRDMFQIVYEMKKKQIEDAKIQQIMQQQNIVNKLQVDAITNNTNGHHIEQQRANETLMECTPMEDSGQPAVGHLLDLELELETLEQDIQKINEWAAFSEDHLQNDENIHSAMVHSVSAPNGYSIDDHFKENSETNGFVETGVYSRPRPNFQLKPQEEVIVYLPPPSAPQSSRRAANSNLNNTFQSMPQNGTTNMFNNGSSLTSNLLFNTVGLSNGTVAEKPALTAQLDPFDTSHVSQVLKENWTISNAPMQQTLPTMDEHLPEYNGTPQSSTFDPLTPQILNDKSETSSELTPSIMSDDKSISTEKSAFEKLCNLDALCNPESQKLQNIGVITSVPPSTGSMPKCSSKKSLNELRDEKCPNTAKMAVSAQSSYELQNSLIPTTQIAGVEKSMSMDFFNDTAKITDNGINVENRDNFSDKKNLAAAASAAAGLPPIIPPRISTVNGPTAVLPRPEVGQRQTKGILPPPLPSATKQQGAEKKKNSDPFADEFFFA